MTGRAIRRVAAVAVLVVLAALAGCGGTGSVEGLAAKAAPPAPPQTSPAASAGTTGSGADQNQQDPQAERGPTATRQPSGSATAAAQVTPPDLARSAPPSGSSSSSPSRRVSGSTATAGGGGQDTATTLHIGSWSARVVRGGQDKVDACRDAVQWTGPDLGTENGYEMRTAVVVGHDYCGFQRFATLRAGTVVSVTSPRGTFYYRVYANYRTPGRGTPAHGLYWGDLTLQSCVGQNTGFSYLTRTPAATLTEPGH